MRTEPDFVSQQTYAAERFYLDLNPAPTHPFRVVCGGVERTLPDYKVERTDFPYLGIELVAEGAGLLELGKRQYPLKPGVVFAYGPGVPHCIRNSPPGTMRKYFLDVAGADAECMVRDAGLLDNRIIVVARVFELIELWNLIGREARDENEHATDLCEGLARILLLKIRQRTISAASEIPVAYHTFEAIRRFMEDHFLEFTTVEQVAKACEVNPIYLTRLFKRFAGSGAYRFLLRLRMNHAAEQMMTNGVLVREIAEELQFADAFQFSRAFKRIYGVSPSQLIESNR